MVHKDVIERRNEKFKPRGKPFQKGNKNGKVENEIPVSSKPEIINEGEFIDSLKKSEIVTQLLENGFVSQKFTADVKENSEKKSLELVESIDFKNGENKLSIRFSKRHNRMYRIQIFLNDNFEIRPVTYTGSSMALTFWNLLKGALKI